MRTIINKEKGTYMRFQLAWTAMSLVMVSIGAKAAPQADLNSIQHMAGCHSVSFHFEETGTTDPHYPIKSPIYNESGIEQVIVDQVSENHVALQHILKVGPGPNDFIKHWRQEWDFEANDRFQFMGLATWTTQPLFQQTGKWVQRVFQVDDSPRYECDAAFTHIQGQNSYWECATDAPLPRREFTQRNDYQILNRGNRHEMTVNGWLHIQNNKKIKLNGNSQEQIATEFGLDTYLRMNETQCAGAKEWWQKRKAAWNTIQDMWKHVRGHHTTLKLNPKSSNPAETRKLFEKLNDLAEAAAQEAVLDLNALSAAAHDAIHEYF